MIKKHTNKYYCQYQKFFLTDKKKKGQAKRLKTSYNKYEKYTVLIM